MYPGKLIVLEGIDFSGKSTQVKYLVQYLQSKGCDVVQAREPGGTKVGERIREILLTEPMHGLTEMLLFTASRTELMFEKTLPALKAGKVVVLDRFIDSTYAYQGFGRGFLEEVMKVEEIITRYINPDVVFYLDITLKTYLNRIQLNREQAFDRLDVEGLEFKKKLIEGFNHRLQQRPDKTVHIDANRDPEAVTASLINWIDKHFLPRHSHLINRQESTSDV